MSQQNQRWGSEDAEQPPHCEEVNAVTQIQHQADGHAQRGRGRQEPLLPDVQNVQEKSQGGSRQGKPIG
jgi:hypothetical protein